MANTTKAAGTVVGYFDSHSAAEEAVKDLKESGFNSNQIGIAARSEVDVRSTGKTSPPTEGFWERIKEFFTGDSDTSTSKRTTNYGDDYDYQSEDVRHSMSGLSVPEEQSRYFGHRFEQGNEGAIVTVSAAGREQEAERILQENGADLGENVSSYDYTSRDMATDANEQSGQQRIQLLGEVLRVHTERVNRGEVRLRKEVITENQTVQVPVTREEFVIERVAASGSPAQGSIGSDQEIRIPLSEERPVVDKETVVREEVAVGKRAVKRVENVGGDVRREEVRVEQDGVEGTENADREKKAANF